MKCQTTTLRTTKIIGTTLRDLHIFRITDLADLGLCFKTSLSSYITMFKIQTDSNHLNKYYSWTAVVFIQVVCIGLYVHEETRQFVFPKNLKLHLFKESKDSLRICLFSASLSLLSLLWRTAFLYGPQLQKNVKIIYGIT